MSLKNLLECDNVPNLRQEIPTPEVAKHHPHLADIATELPPINDDAEISLLIGRDLIKTHHVLDQRIGRRNSPNAQKLPLGWVIIGESCIGTYQKLNLVNVNKTYLLPNGRPSLFEPCPNGRSISEKGGIDEHNHIFVTRKDDDKPSLSVEDKEFIMQMDSGFRKDKDGNWSAPLPFRSSRPRLPKNYEYACNRAKSLHANLQRNPVKCEQFVEFIRKLLKNGHAELAPKLTENRECWYLPVFGVYHPHKPGQIRCVFDPSSKFKERSLNSVLLQGPDLTNSLLGILLRFRRESVPIVADIQHMFYSFRVHEDHRDVLRFLWHAENNLEKPLVEYRMCVHVFGNSPSPAIATYGLRKSVRKLDEDIENFVNRDFYVNDALTSLPTVHEAIDVMKRTQEALAKIKLVLHKVASNNEEVILAFPTNQLAIGLKDLNLGDDVLPVQRNLGLQWDMNKDSFFCDVSTTPRSFTRRGVLSVVNSLFDPIGFLAPITIQGKLILRNLMNGTIDWDEPLPPDKLSEWVTWKDSLVQLKHVHIPRCYSTESLSQASKVVLHVFFVMHQNLPSQLCPIW
ncbi:uncharacterized protein LOC121386135 [Gigantopelta aegis]|uniref:uncharacterized protein LOC121386135 n=1 Tax=Gigantopelta aegis TaxID=1735272 RepID=UPI001B88E000|nr:uncharacterized protein LOC121386135 [Gigantopelta aegis]